MCFVNTKDTNRGSCCRGHVAISFLTPRSTVVLLQSPVAHEWELPTQRRGDTVYPRKFSQPIAAILYIRALTNLADLARKGEYVSGRQFKM